MRNKVRVKFMKQIMIFSTYNFILLMYRKVEMVVNQKIYLHKVLVLPLNI